MADYDRIGKISHTTSLPLSTLILSPSYRELRSNWSSGGWLQQERTGAEALERDGGEPQTPHRSLACSQGMFCSAHITVFNIFVFVRKNLTFF